MAVMRRWAGLGLVILACAMPATSAAAQTAREKFEQLVEAGLLSPDQNRNGSPDENLTREQVARIIGSLFDPDLEGGPETPEFSEVDVNHWARRYVQASVNPSTLGQGGLDPAGKVTREEIDRLIDRILDTKTEAGRSGDSDSEALTERQKRALLEKRRREEQERQRREELAERNQEFLDRLEQYRKKKEEQLREQREEIGRQHQELLERLRRLREQQQQLAQQKNQTEQKQIEVVQEIIRDVSSDDPSPSDPGPSDPDPSDPSPWADYPFYDAGQLSPAAPTAPLDSSHTSAVYNGRLVGAFDGGGQAIGGDLTLLFEFGLQEIGGNIAFDDGDGNLLVHGGWDGNDISASLTANDTVFGGAIADGQMDGAFYGPQGENIGGTWSFDLIDNPSLGTSASGKFAASQSQDR